MKYDILTGKGGGSMKKGLILTLLLSVILAGVMAFSAHLILEQNRTQEEYNRQCQMLEQQKSWLANAKDKLRHADCLLDADL